MIACLLALAQVRSLWISHLDLSVATQGWGSPGVDQSVDRHPITIAGRTFEHGFGTHSPGRLIVKLDGKATRFSAFVGIDDEVPAGRGSAEFIVYGAHKLWSSGIMRRGDAPKAVDVSLRGERKVTLIVTDAGDGFDYDHADWADAKIDYAGKEPKAVAYHYATPRIALRGRSEKPIFHGPSLVGVRTGTPVVWSAAVEGVRPLRFKAAGLPVGLTLDPATGAIGGVAKKQGRFRVRLTATNRIGVARRTMTLAVGPKVALTPPMGWNSYDAFGDNVNENEILKNAAFEAKYLQPFGWDTAVVDYRWYDPGAHDNNPNGRAGALLTMDRYGRLLASPNRFPSAEGGVGFKALADKVHAMGLRFGIHIMRGIPRLAVNAAAPIEGSDYTAADAADTNDKCGWCPDMFGVRGDTPAGQAYYDSIFRLYASWGVDFVKMDDTSYPYQVAEIDAVRKAIDRCGRSIVYSLSPGETPIEQAAHVAAHANMWRVSGDFWDQWSALSHEFDLAKRWQPWPGEGHWPDADMIPVGHLSVSGRSVGPDRQTRFAKIEQVTLISLWCLLPSPLMLGADLRQTDPWTLRLLTNPEVLALDQDASPKGAVLARKNGDVEVWKRILADGSVAVGVFNRGETDAPVHLKWTEFGSGLAHGRDLWRRVNMKGEGWSGQIPAHGSLLVRLSRR